jgi:hypothetical protein
MSEETKLDPAVHLAQLSSKSVFARALMRLTGKDEYVEIVHQLAAATLEGDRGKENQLLLKLRETVRNDQEVFEEKDKRKNPILRIFSEIKSPEFKYAMSMILYGTLVALGKGKITPEKLDENLQKGKEGFAENVETTKQSLEEEARNGSLSATEGSRVAGRLSSKQEPTLEEKSKEELSASITNKNNVGPKMYH